MMADLNREDFQILKERVPHFLVRCHTQASGKASATCQHLGNIIPLGKIARNWDSQSPSAI